MRGLLLVFVFVCVVREEMARREGRPFCFLVVE